MSQATIIRNGNSLSGLIGVDTTGAASGDYLTFNGTSWVPARERYTNAAAMTVTVGGWEAGSTFAGLTMQQMWDGLLYPYQYPAFTSFVLVGQSLALEVGDHTNGGTSTFTWTTSYPTNIASASIDLTDVSSGTILASGLANDGTETVVLPVITYAVPATHTYGISALNTKAEPLSRTTSVSWYWREYWGVTATTPIGSAEIVALADSALGNTFAGAWAFAASPAEYKYLAYPLVWGTATTFKDQATNFDVPMETAYTVVVANTFGATATYNVHRSTNLLGGALTIVVS